MDYQLQVITLSVSDVDKATAFYTQRAGFTLDVDYRPASDFRVVQLTPPGSACSVQIGTGLTDAPPGSARATYLAVTDIEAAHRELTARGVTVSGIRHKSPIDDWKGGFRPVLTRSAATMPASPTSPTRTATPGSSRRSATGRRKEPAAASPRTDRHRRRHTQTVPGVPEPFGPPGARPRPAHAGPG